MDNNTNFSFYDKGKGKPLVLLNGLFGSLANWRSVAEHFSGSYRMIIPEIPIHKHPKMTVGVQDLIDYIKGLVDHLGIKDFVLFGNSLGGQLALSYAIQYPESTKGLVLAGSSGLVEKNILGSSFPRINNRSYVEKMTEICFYDPKIPHPEIIDEVWERTRKASYITRFISLARSTIRNTLEKNLHEIKVPTLLVWGLNDTITPTYAAYKFHRLIKRSVLHFIDKCCHVPMMEHPKEFNRLVANYLNALYK